MADDEMGAMPADPQRTSPQRVSAALSAARTYYACTTLQQRGFAYSTGRGIDVAFLKTRLAEREVGRIVGDPRYPTSPLKSIDLYRPHPAPAYSDGRVIVVEGAIEAAAIAVAIIRTGQAPLDRPPQIVKIAIR